MKESEIYYNNMVTWSRIQVLTLTLHHYFLYAYCSYYMSFPFVDCGFKMVKVNEKTRYIIFPVTKVILKAENSKLVVSILWLLIS